LFLAQYFTDTALLDCSLVKDKPSKVAAVSIYAALRIFKGDESPIWNSLMVKYTGYRENDLKGMSADLI
jgi:hypothetical protein